MRTSRRMMLVPALAGLCVLGGVVAATAAVPSDAGKAPAPICWKTTVDADAAPGGHKTGDFCDKTPDHGTSKSCKAEAAAKGLLVCATGNPTNVNCNVGQSCDSGNGHWCDCSYDCTGTVAEDPDGDGEVDPVEPDR